MQEKFYQYHLIRELAKKHSHSTYLASPIEEPEHQVVLIVFPGLLFPLWREHENVLQNTQSLKELQHPRLAPILDMGVEEGQPFVVREYLPNGSLRSRLKKISAQRLELNEALTIVSQVGEALAYAHEHQLLHGNIKPENVLFDAHDHTILVDFSLINEKDTYIRDQTSEEYAFCYMAPERFAGIGDARSDQYGLGCLTYELITGQVPFAAQTLAAIMEYHTKTLPTPLSQHVANLPSDLEAAVLKTLAKDPAERFSDCSLFIGILKSILSAPAFPFALSTHASKNKTISRPVRLAKAENDSSPVCTCTPSQLSESLEASPRAKDNLLEAVLALPTYQVNIAEQREVTALPSLEASISELIIAPQIKEERGAVGIALLESSVQEQAGPRADWIISSLTRNTGVLGPGIVRTLRGRTKLIGLVLLFTIILALVTYALWPLVTTKLGTSSHSIVSIKNKPKPRLASTPMFIVVSTQTSRSIVTPAASSTVTPGLILTPTPTPAPRPNPTPTVVVNADPYPPSGTLALNDPLSDNSRGYGWQETSGSCQFIGGAYHAIEMQSGFNSCHAAAQVSNFTFEVQMQIIQGACGGIVLRDTTSQADTYFFEVCQNGSYSFARIDGTSGSWQTLTSNSSGAIVTGLNQSNLLAAVANGGTFDLYINHQEIITINDSIYSQGQIGVVAKSNCEVAYTNARIWTL